MIKFGKETKKTYYHYDIEVDEEDRKKLLKYALKKIRKDENALINYAINLMLQEMVDEMQAEWNKIRYN